MKKTLGETLRELRKRAGLSQAQLARLATPIRYERDPEEEKPIDVGTISRIERGESKNPHPSTIWALIHVLKESLGDIGDIEIPGIDTSKAPIQLLGLPSQVYQFVDREDLIEAIGKRLEVNEYIGIHGMPGVGKSALATEIAYKFLGNYERIIHYSLDEIEIQNELEAVDFLNNRLRHQGPTDVEGSAQNKKARLIDELDNRKTLIIFDNVQNQSTLNNLLACVGRRPVIITSRDCMDPRNLSVQELAEFERVDSIELFRVRASYDALSDVEAREANSICEILGDLALAIEISAARAPIFKDTFQDIHNDLKTKLFETLDVRGAIDSNQEKELSIEITFDISFEKLSQVEQYPNLQSFFSSLGVFRGESFSIEAVESINGVDDVEDQLKFLCSLSLVKRHTAGRYSLHPLLKEYALRKLDDAGAFERMGNYYLQFIENEEVEITDELQNLYGAVNWFESSGRWDEVSNLLNRIRDMLYVKGYWTDLIRSSRNILTNSRQNGDSKNTAIFACVLGHLMTEQGENEEARALLNESLEISEINKDDSMIGRVQKAIGTLNLREGKYEEAAAHLEKSKEIARKQNDQTLYCHSIHEMGVALMWQSKFDLAKDSLRESLDLARELKDQSLIIPSLVNLAFIELHTSNFPDAKALYNQALDVARMVGDKKGEAGTLADMAVLFINLGEFEESKRLSKDSLEIRRDLGDKRGIVFNLHNLSVACLKTNDLENAERAIREGLPMAKEVEDVRLHTFITQGAGRLELEKGNYDEASQYFNESLPKAKELQDPRTFARAIFYLGCIAAAKENAAEAYRLIWQGLAIFKHFQFPDMKEAEEKIKAVEGRLPLEEKEDLDRELEKVSLEQIFEAF